MMMKLGIAIIRSATGIQVLPKSMNKSGPQSSCMTSNKDIVQQVSNVYNKRYLSSSSSSSRPFTNKAAKVVVVGAGRMGHIRSNIVNANPKFQLMGIVDQSMDHATKLSGKYNVNSYSNLSEVLRKEQEESEDESQQQQQQQPNLIDGIICCSPTSTHHEIIEFACRHSIDVFVEKPVDATSTKIEALFDSAEKAQINLCCGFQRRFDQSYQHALNVVHIGEIGTAITANIFFGDHPVPHMDFLLEGGGDIFMDLSAHDVDYILQVLKDDKVQSVYALGTSSTHELKDANVHDNATMILQFQSGVVVTIFMSRSATYGYDQRCEIFATDGRVQVGNIHENSCIKSTAEGHLSSKYQHSFPQRFHQAFSNEMDTFADVLLSPTALSWPITKADCVEVQKIADAAQESQKTGQVIELL